MNKRMISLRQSILFFVIAVAVLGIPFSTYALDKDCLTSRTYFNNCENMISYNDDNGLNGVTRYNLDAREGCFYFYINFRDDMIKEDAKDRIYFRFYISNELESIHFDVDENGMDAASAENLKSKVDVISDFYSTSCRNQGGKVVIAFELKDKEYRKLLNSIRCDYYCGSRRSYNLLDNVCLDMREKTTAKTSKTTSEKTSVQKIESQRKTEKIKNSSRTAKSDESTKFIPSKRRNTTEKNSTSASTKFNAEKHVYSEANSNSSVNDEEYWSRVISSHVSPDNQQTLDSTGNSDNRRLFIYIAVIVLGIGTVVMIYGVSGVNKNCYDRDFDESNDEKE